MTKVSLTFDDGLDVHLDTVIPRLDRRGLKGTFYIDVGSERFARRHHDWREAAARGHELGNHTIFHPGVSSKSWVTEGTALENYSLDRMERELRMASTVLNLVDGRDQRTFAFPCSNPFLGRPGWPSRLLNRAGLARTRLQGWVNRFSLDFGSRLVDYTPLARQLFFASRCGGLPVAQLPAQPPDRHRVRGFNGDGLDGDQLCAAVDEAAGRGVWLVMVLHGVGGGHQLGCDVPSFEKLIDRLAGDPAIEVLTFLDAARRIWGTP
jgi:peptidoglycan/xylan/chitin deacetylase (PgdA/CDA1 family)